MNRDQKIEPEDWDNLVERHLFGELTEAEMERLAELLDSAPALQRDLIERATWETELAEFLRSGDEGAVRQFAPPDLHRLRSGQRGSIRFLRGMLAVAAAAILLLSGLLFQSRNATDGLETIAAEQEKPIAQITGQSGPMIWTGDRGQIIRDVEVGTNLAGGTIEGLSPDSWFELRFNDGSEVTISGASLLTFSDDGQKKLRLREGRLSADVTPQPNDKPLVIQTRSATLTVLGTSFDVEAGLPATAVNVRQGTVRVTRTSDGKEIDVPANHRVVAAADQKLERQQIADIVHHWKSRIDRGPDETFGKWIAATDSQPAFLKAVDFVPEEAPHVVLYLLGLGVRSDEGAPIQVNDQSRFGIHGKTDLQTDIYFGIQVTYASGDFAGKFLAKCEVDRDSSGKFVARVGLDDFVLDPSVAAYKNKLAPSPDGLFINGIWSFTHSESPSGLRVSEVNLFNTKQ